MNNYLAKKIIDILIIIFLALQVLIYFVNQKPLTKNFSQKKITVENFSSIVLSNSGMTKIGSEKLNKVDSYLQTSLTIVYSYNNSICKINTSNRPNPPPVFHIPFHKKSLMFV